MTAVPALTLNTGTTIPQLGFGTYQIDPQDTVEPIRKLKRLAAEKGYQLIPGHDPHVWPELTQHFHDRFGPVES